MSYSVAEFLNSRKTAIQRAIDLTLSNRSANGTTYTDGMPDPALDRFFPLNSYLSDMVAWLKFKHQKPTLAFIRGEDGEVPMTREEMTMTQEQVGSFNVSVGRIYTEADKKKLRQIRQMQAEGGGSATAAQELLTVYEATQIQLTNSVLNTYRMMAQAVATTGQVSFADPRTGTTVAIDYTNGIPAGHLAAAKTGTAQWSDLTNATPIADIVTHLNVIYGNLRMFPPAIWMPGVLADYLRDCNSTKVEVVRFFTPNADITSPSTLPRPTLDQIRQVIGSKLTSSAQGAGGAPEIIVTDAIYYQRDANEALTSSTYHPAKYYSFGFDSYIEQALVPCATNNFAGGLAFVAEIGKFTPLVDKSAIDSAGTIIVPDARYIAARKVLE